MKATGVTMTAAIALLAGSTLALAAGPWSVGPGTASGPANGYAGMAPCQGGGPGMGPGGGPGMRGQRGFWQFDGDGDGRLTLEEMASVRLDRFAAMDVDGDGTLTPEEFEDGARTFMETRMRQRFQALDLDEDGMVTEAEFLARLDSRATMMMDRHFIRLDGDEDGRVSEDEFAAFGDMMFARWDYDDDGVIDLEDMDRGPRGMGGMRGGGPGMVPGRGPGMVPGRGPGMVPGMGPGGGRMGPVDE